MDLKISEMQDMQKQLQERYRDNWGGLYPEKAKEQLLWTMIELGEAADILKKSGCDAVMRDKAARDHFVEEMCDVLMYFHDVLLCCDIGYRELGEKYVEKFRRNMKRWPVSSERPDSE